MKNPINASQFLKVIINRQAYLNLVYLFATFPLGVFYFVFLVSGLSIGLSLTIIWVGIPILVVVAACWWMLAKFEYTMANHVLKEELHPIALASREGSNPWTRFKTYLENPFTWKSLLYLFMKFPIGIFTFTILVTLISLTVFLIGMPMFYLFLDNFTTSISLGPVLPVWQIDNLAKALLCGLIGLLLWPMTLHTLNGLTWLHAKLARLMLNSKPIGSLAAIY
jgi:hypothetical protein